MAKKLALIDLPPVVGRFRLSHEYEGPKPRPGMHVFIECMDCGDNTRYLPAYLWNAAAKGKQAISCAKCRVEKHGTTRARKAGARYTAGDPPLSLTLPEWAERTNLNLRAMYARAQARAKLPPEHRQTDDYVIFGSNVDHPYRHIHTRPLKALDKVLDHLIVETQEVLKAHITRIAEDLINSRLRPALADLVHAGVIGGDSKKHTNANIDPALGVVTDADPDDLPPGWVWALDAGERSRGSKHDPNNHHPHDHEQVGLNCTLLQYRRQYGDEEAINPEWGRWVTMEKYRLDADFEYERMLNEPVLPEDIAAARAEEKEREDAEKAKAAAEKAEKLRMEQLKKQIAEEPWTIRALEGEKDMVRSPALTYVIPENQRVIPKTDDRLPEAKRKDMRQGGKEIELNPWFLLDQRDPDAYPLSKEAIQQEFLRWPWWSSEGGYTGLGQLRRTKGATFGHICPTQYDRIWAFYAFTNPAQGGRASMIHLSDPDAHWLKSNHDYNLLTNLEAISEWGIRMAMQCIRNDEEAIANIKKYVERGRVHQGKPIRDLAEKIVDEWSELLQLPKELPDLD